MANSVVLAILEVVAIIACGYGLVNLVKTSAWLNVVYGSFWFILGTLSNVCGLIGLWLMNFGVEDEISKGSQYWVQYHYLLAWLTIVIGYPTFLVQVWMVHHPKPWAHAFVILSLIPLIAWINRKTRAIVLSTQIVTVVAIIAHVWISVLAGQKFGMIGAGIMTWNVLALSVPTKYSFLGLTSREFYVIGLAATSVVFALEVADAAKNPVIVKSLTAKA